MLELGLRQLRIHQAQLGIEVLIIEGLGTLVITLLYELADGLHQVVLL
jgi:hypothetical protein